MGAVFSDGSTTLYGFGGAACGKGVGVCWGALGCWPGKSRAVESPDARDGTAGLWRRSRSAVADARAGAVPRAGSGTSGPWSVAGCGCSARSRRSGIQPVTGAVSPSRRFRVKTIARPPQNGTGHARARPHGECVQNPASGVNTSPRAREIFWKFSQRV